MEKYCGDLKLVGNLKGGETITQVDQYGRQKFIGSVKVATEVDGIQIGDKSLTKVRCEGVLYNELQQGRDACIYIYRHLYRTALLLGVKYNDSGEKHMVSSGYYRGTVIQFATVHALLMAIGCWIGGMIVGGVIGLGQSAVPPVLGLLAGLAISWWSAFRFYKDYHEALADVA